MLNMNKTSKVIYDKRKDCFIAISDDLKSCVITSNRVCEVSDASGVVYVTWSGDVCAGSGAVHINGLYAHKLGLQDQQQVLLRLLSDVATCTRVFLEPLSVQDWEILELHSGFIESNLLHQLRVVWPGQVFPVWIRNVCAFVKTGVIDPGGPCALLSARTEVIVAPRDRRSASKRAASQAAPSRTSSTVQPSACTVQSQADQLSSSGHKSLPFSSEPTPNGTTKESLSHSLEKESADKESADKEGAADKESADNAPAARAVKKTRFSDTVTEFEAPPPPVVEDSVTNSLDSSQGLLGSALHYLRSWFTSGPEPGNDTDTKNVVTPFLAHRWELNARVQDIGALVDKSLESNIVPVEITEQPTNVYISESTFMSGFPGAAPTVICEKQRTFLARLECLPAPIEREEAAKRQEKAGQRGGSQRTKPPGAVAENKAADSAESEGEQSGQSCAATAIVRVIVLDRRNRYTLRAPSGKALVYARLGGSCGMLDRHVMMTSLLRRQLACDVTGRVWLAALASSQQAAQCSELELHPLFDQSADATGTMLETAFRSWVSRCTDTCLPLVTGPGTLVSVPLSHDRTGECLLSFPTPSTQHPGTSNLTHYLTLHRHLVEKMRVSVQSQVDSKRRPAWLPRLPCYNTEQLDPQTPQCGPEELGGVRDVLDSILQHASLCTKLSATGQGYKDSRARQGQDRSETGQGQDGSRTSEGHEESKTGQGHDESQTVQGHIGSRTRQGHDGSQTGQGHCGSQAGQGVLLVCGARGVGKTALCQAVCSALVQTPTYAYCSLVDCKALRGRRPDTITQTVSRTLREAVWRAPALVVLDDLDAVCGAAGSPEQELSSDALYYNKVAHGLRELLKTEVRAGRGVCVIVTSQSHGSLHPLLAAAQGLPLIRAEFTLKLPDQACRAEILRALCTRLGVTVSDADVESVARGCEGCVARDLEHLLRRADILLQQRDEKSRELTREALDSAREGFRPAALATLTLQQPPEVTWGHVGGLREARDQLLETLQLPSQYPELFSRCPLRLRSGLLLYGAPGTGKTLLASVVARECGLNFISIKGPELLSKYIGASEAAVRNTFTRAQSARPCLVFFDEFDSLAPRRGHDSTGVTDRVVNQLLTQLDGVETLQGVYVLAATSRPDLIDPALLRPGRLDKAVHCPIPDQTERAEILAALTRDLSLSADVDLYALAVRTPGFTGADFKALLYNAQLAAIHEQHGEALGGSGGVPGEQSGARKAKNSDSENSVTSTGSWEAVTAPPREEYLLVEERPRLCYMSSLEDGLAEVSEERSRELHRQVSWASQTSLERLNSATQPTSTTTSTGHTVTLQQRHLDTALLELTLSVSSVERARFSSIYAQFVASRGSQFTEVAADKRATLA